MNRDEVIAIIGEPDKISSTTKKYRIPMVYRYGNVELYFGPLKDCGLTFVQEVEPGIGHVRYLLR